MMLRISRDGGKTFSPKSLELIYKIAKDILGDEEYSSFLAWMAFYGHIKKGQWRSSKRDEYTNRSVLIVENF